jgi:protein-S-isoprenylcysteine O-methyltransferase Ste14
MDTARYIVAVMLLLSVPPALGLWYAIHPFARAWRRIGAAATYAVLAVPFLGLGWLIWRWRGVLVGADLGTQPALVALGAAAFAVAAGLARSRRRQLTQRILVGVPELSRTDKGRLLTEGIYARVRNPRYLEFMSFVLGYAAFANFSGTWALLLLVLPATHLLVLMEEQELRERFGEEYEAYCRRVPRWVPRTRRTPGAGSATNGPPALP